MSTRHGCSPARRRRRAPTSKIRAKQHAGRTTKRSTGTVDRSGHDNQYKGKPLKQGQKHNANKVVPQRASHKWANSQGIWPTSQGGYKLVSTQKSVWTADTLHTSNARLEPSGRDRRGRNTSTSRPQTGGRQVEQGRQALRLRSRARPYGFTPVGGGIGARLVARGGLLQQAPRGVKRPVAAGASWREAACPPTRLVA